MFICDSSDNLKAICIQEVYYYRRIKMKRLLILLLLFEIQPKGINGQQVSYKIHEDNIDTILLH